MYGMHNPRNCVGRRRSSKTKSGFRPSSFVVCVRAFVFETTNDDDDDDDNDDERRTTNDERRTANDRTTNDRTTNDDDVERTNDSLLGRSCVCSFVDSFVCLAAINDDDDVDGLRRRRTTERRTTVTWSERQSVCSLNAFLRSLCIDKRRRR